MADEKKRGLWWWIDRWRSSDAFMDLTLAGQGAYRNLLDEYRLRGGHLPNDDRVLAKACGDPLEWPNLRDQVMAKFALVDGVWRNAVADEVNGFTEAQSRKGKARAEGAAREKGRFAPAPAQPAETPAEPPADGPAENQPPYPYPYPYPLSVSVSGADRTEGENGAHLPAADRTETAIRKTADGMRSKLYGLIDEMRRVDPKGRDPTELMRMVTSYRKADGKQVHGVVNAALLSFERLEKSIADAEANLADWRARK